ncbi:MAG: methyltransferase domain-containing protein [Anaerolineae bacterium]|jgi:SAM-dependent methyltransferase|nr:methyltransferase domain-containing protein [Anaerolineae bacterium]
MSMSLKRWLFRTFRPAIVAARTLWYAGRRYACPVCGGRFRRMRAFTGVYRLRGDLVDHFTPNAICPRCGAGLRQRLLFAVLAQRVDFTRPQSLLHFAPEETFFEFFSRQPALVYIPADLEPLRFLYPAALQADIRAVPLRTNSVDGLVCSHVLEHIVEDEQALAELCRVLKPGGYAAIAVPIYGATTYEDRTLDAAGRERMYGIDLHVRLNGLDMRHKLERAGFAVETLTLTDVPAQYFDLTARSAHVDSDRYVFFCTKR